MIKYRYFPFLGIKKFDDQDKIAYDIPLDLECTGLVFEWLGVLLLISGAVYRRRDDNGN